MSGTNKLVQSEKEGKSESVLASALENANEVVIAMDKKKKKK